MHVCLCVWPCEHMSFYVIYDSTSHYSFPFLNLLTSGILSISERSTHTATYIAPETFAIHTK